MRVAGSHNYSRSAPALQSNVDLLSAKGSKEPIDSSHASILAQLATESSHEFHRGILTICLICHHHDHLCSHGGKLFSLNLL